MFLKEGFLSAGGHGCIVTGLWPSPCSPDYQTLYCPHPATPNQCRLRPSALTARTGWNTLPFPSLHFFPLRAPPLPISPPDPFLLAPMATNLGS